MVEIGTQPWAHIIASAAKSTDCSRRSPIKQDHKLKSLVNRRNLLGAAPLWNSPAFFRRSVRRST